MCQKLFFFKYPTRYIWGDPGFPSLFVPYDITCDFYFSGHTGILIIFTLNNFTRRRKLIGLFTLVFTMYMITLLMVYQAHYSIDCPVGIIAATYAFILIHNRERLIDGFLRSITMDRWKDKLGFFYDTEHPDQVKKQFIREARMSIDTDM